ncbi:MAG: 4Fe-4S binding protein [Oscillospiraceae bacterium]|nr:4Fe-4S binding protein [Oscillospiraceae bacterium]
MKKKFPYRAALVACNGGCRASQDEPKCGYGCIGCGACAAACKFGAISVNGDGVAEVDEEKCVACGACARVCPQKIIRIHECANYIVVKCSNRDRGADARKECRVSCIGCGICEKACTAGAIRVRENCAVIDEDRCLSCGMCSVKCPRHAIYDLRGIFTRKS